MDSLIKYFIHFFLILTIMFSIFMILIFFDGGYKLFIVAIVLYIFSIFIFAIPMSFLYTSLGRAVVLEIENDQQGVNLNLLKEIIINKAKRTESIKKDNETIYYSKNFYSRWLTSDINILEDDNKLIIKLPISYKSVLEKKLKIYLPIKN